MLREESRSRLGGGGKERNSCLLSQVYTVLRSAALPPPKLMSSSHFDSYDYFSTGTESTGKEMLLETQRPQWNQKVVQREAIQREQVSCMSDRSLEGRHKSTLQLSEDDKITHSLGLFSESEAPSYSPLMLLPWYSLPGWWFCSSLETPVFVPAGTSLKQAALLVFA